MDDENAFDRQPAASPVAMSVGNLTAAARCTEVLFERQKHSLQTIGTPAYRMMSRATRPPTNSAKVTCVSLFHQRSTHLLHCLERIAGLTKNVAPTKCRPSPERRHTAGPATLLMQLNRNRLSAPPSGHVPASISGVASQSVARKATRRNSWRATLAATVSAHQLG